jgi:putative solute:sodium symporter small subunit
LVCTEFASRAAPDTPLSGLGGGGELAQEVPANDHPARDRHQFQTLILAVALLLTVLLAVLAVIFAAPWLNDYGFLHFPLGFYLLAQGLLVYVIVVAFWFIRIQERIDVSRGEREGSG